jgi:hypothetical protein
VVGELISQAPASSVTSKWACGNDEFTESVGASREYEPIFIIMQFITTCLRSPDKKAILKQYWIYYNYNYEHSLGQIIS